MTYSAFKTFRGRNPMLSIETVATKLKIGKLQAIAWDARLDAEAQVTS